MGEMQINGEKLYRNHMIDVHLYHFCIFSSEDKGRVKIHSEAVHEGKKLACDLCDHRSSDPSNLRRHIRLIHKVLQDRYNCELCNYSGTTSIAIKHHLVKQYRE